MRLSEIFQQRDFVMSVEIFPPKSDEADAVLRKNLQRMAEFEPAFVSCTYGAGGTTQDRTIEWCQEIQTEYSRTATAHFTCVGSTRDQLIDWLNRAKAAGIHNIMALRGDAPADQESFQTVEGGLSYANELVELIRETHPDFGIGVAGYPEKHPEAADPATDLANLKRKVDAGGDAVFTQLFYENDAFLKFRDNCNQTGISVPIVPGLMPITSFARIKRITSMCGAAFPADLASKLEAVQDDKQAQFEIGVEFAIEQCQQLIAEGVPGIHFYVLNRSSACERILDALGMLQS